MTDEYKLQEEINRAYKASQLLEDELLVKAFNDIEASYLKAWEESPTRDTEGREKIWTALKMLKKVRNDLKTHVETGKMARSQLDVMKQKVKKYF